jgi:hypothetical protein
VKECMHHPGTAASRTLQSGDRMEPAPRIERLAVRLKTPQDDQGNETQTPESRVDRQTIQARD